MLATRLGSEGVEPVRGLALDRADLAAAAVLSELRDRVRAVELECEAERGSTGQRVLGRRAVLAQSWRDRPTTREPRRNLRPHVAGRSK